MITQQHFVDVCHRLYQRKKVELGNPIYGEWHKAHHPIPANKGGTEWVWLLKHHHAIHGVIQSEEVGSCCVFGWELEFLPHFYRKYHDKWRDFHCAQTQQARQDGWKKWCESEKSFEDRLRMATISGEIAKKNRKPVVIVFQDGAEKQFPSLTIAAQEINMSPGNLSSLIASSRTHLTRGISARYL